MVLALASCDRRKVSSQAPAAPSRPPVIDSITVEKHADGLFYQQGAETPFTGLDVEPDRQKPPQAGKPPCVVSTSYQAGKRHGPTRYYFSNGALQEERIYENGAARSTTKYYPKSQGGGKKMEAALNERKLIEGRSVRYSPEGKIEIEAHTDADEKTHGESKEYGADGSLAGHYRWEHGKLVEIVFETPQQKTLRESKGAGAP